MKNIQIAIHHREKGFSKRWVEYCKENGVPYKVVNCYDSNIMSQLALADGLLWHWDHHIPEDVLAAQNIIYAAELMGLKVFPDTATCWSYDDKVAQKYLLEAVGAPLAPTHVFYERSSAMNWVKQTTFPKVFKLQRGSGSMNVRLVRNAAEARLLVNKAFGCGFKPAGPMMRHIRTKVKNASWRQRLEILKKVRQFPQRLLLNSQINKKLGRECGYVYFQDFIPDNKFDTRVTVIGGRQAFGFTRDVRKDDFRASGSGKISYDLNRINPNCVKIAFDVSKKIGTQSIAFDFVIDAKAQPRIVEISYCYLADAVYNCPGHWDEQLQWHEGHIWPEDAIIKYLLEQLRQTREEATENGTERS